jgi:hypothetical protein
MIAVTAVAVNAAARLNPGVGESKMSNKVGSGRAKVAARRLLNHVSIPSNNTEYANVEFEPESGKVQDIPFHTPHVPSLLHRAPRILRTPVTSRGSSHGSISLVGVYSGNPPRRRDRPRGVNSGLSGVSTPLDEKKGGSSLDSDSSYRQLLQKTYIIKFIITIQPSRFSDRQRGRPCPRIRHILNLHNRLDNFKRLSNEH